MATAFVSSGEVILREFHGDNRKHHHLSSQWFISNNAGKAVGYNMATPRADFDLIRDTPSPQEYRLSSWQQGWLHQQAANDHNGFLRNVTINQLDQMEPPNDKVISTADPANTVKREHDDNTVVNMADLYRDTSSASRRNSSTASVSKRSRKGSRGHNTDKEASEPEEDTKRQKFLERNRIAASKCRQKKKEWTDGLEDRLRHLQAENTYLTSFTATLSEEVLTLKSEMLKHGSCDCHGIRNYLANQALNLAYRHQTHSRQEGSQYAASASLPTCSMSGSPMQLRGSNSAAGFQEMQSGPVSIGSSRSSQAGFDQNDDSSRCNKSKLVVVDGDIDETLQDFSDKDFNSYLTTTGEDANVQAVT